MATNFLPLVSTVQFISRIACLISSIFGLLVLILTLFGVRNIFGTYKYLMVVFTSFGVFLAVFEVVFHQNLHFYNDGYAFFSLTNYFGFGKTVMNAVMTLYPGMYSVTISMLAVQFMYRYWVLFSLHYMIYFRGWKLLLWVLYCSFFGGTWSIAAYFCLQTDTSSENYFHEEMFSGYNILTEKHPLLIFLAYDPITKNLKAVAVLYSMLTLLIMGIQYSTMIYCSWMMHTKMEEKIANFSNSLKHHHRQMFKTLVLQISTPTIFLFTPIFLVLNVPYLQLQISVPAGATFCLFSIYPAIDSIIILSVISEYRSAAKRLLRAGLLKIIAIHSFESVNSQTEQIQMSTVSRATVQ